MKQILLFLGLLCFGLAHSTVDMNTGENCKQLDQRVKRMIYEVAVPNDAASQFERYEGKQARIFKALEDLGVEAIPFIVKYMDDRRPLPFDHIALKNNVINMRESVRQYSPILVVDALAAILNQLTGVSFEFIYSGAVDSIRDSAVRSWQAYLADKFYLKYPNACI